MAFATPLYPRSQVDKAGVILVDSKAPWDAHVWALQVINNWRSSHTFPLNNFQTNLRSKVKKIQPGVLVAQRIKRLESIAAKLTRDQTSTMQLSQMQDIGGCRAIVKSPLNVARLVHAYKNTRFNHRLKSEKDYIKFPKDDGYRGYHLIYQYQSLPDQNAAYDKLRIEIQIRTALQHAWATAVEAVGTFTKQALKSAQGDEEWRRLFALMGSAIALIEKGPLVPDTPSDPIELRDELRQLATKLNAVRTLGAYRVALDYIGTLNQRASKYFLVRYDSKENKVWVSGYAANASEQANLAYTQQESNKQEGDNIVLVSVSSLKALTRAYPNYFLDTREFTDLLTRTLSPPS